MPEFELLHTLSASREAITSLHFNGRGDWLALGCASLVRLICWQPDSIRHLMRSAASERTALHVMQHPVLQGCAAIISAESVLIDAVPLGPCRECSCLLLHRSLSLMSVPSAGSAAGVGLALGGVRLAAAGPPS